MNLHDKLKEILPALLPRREEEAVKGTELINRVRSTLGEDYSDGTLRTHFSLLALEEGTCLARVPGGHGYYLRDTDEPRPGLQELFCEGNAGADTPLHRAIALAVRLYDATGCSVFAYPVNQDSWTHPDLVVVQWPAGRWGSDGVYRMNPQEPKAPCYRAVCVGLCVEENSLRRDFFRTLSCGEWAQEAELLLVGCGAEAARDVASMGTQFGVGVRSIGQSGSLKALPHADVLLRMDEERAQTLLGKLPQSITCSPQHRATPPVDPQYLPDVRPVLRWVQQCVERGRVEAYERRVAVN